MPARPEDGSASSQRLPGGLPQLLPLASGGPRDPTPFPSRRISYKSSLWSLRVQGLHDTALQDARCILQRSVLFRSNTLRNSSPKANPELRTEPRASKRLTLGNPCSERDNRTDSSG